MNIVPKNKDLETYTRQHQLSKTTFIKGKQCVKWLYLNKHLVKKQNDYSKQKKVALNMGKEFELKFRDKFENAILITDILQYSFHQYAAFTEELLAENTAKTIFEAGIIYNDVLVLTDVLQQNENGSYNIYEVKFMDKIKPVVLWDLALQYYVCKNKLKNIESFNVVLRGKRGKFKISDVTKLLEKEQEKIAQNIEEFKTILKQKNIPKIKIGSQCFRPYECTFFEYCRT